MRLTVLILLIGLNIWCNVKANIINVPADYSTIQDGINAANDGDTVYVDSTFSKTYKEDLVIDKKINLISPNADINPNTETREAEATITGQITVESDNVVINGFTITNPGKTSAILIQNNDTSYSNIIISNNIINDIGGATLAANVHAIYLYRGPDDVSILNNKIMELKSGTHKSVSAIAILDTESTDTSDDVLIQGNVISNIESADIGDRWGAYGIIVNNGAGTLNLKIINNTISNLALN